MFGRRRRQIELLEAEIYELRTRVRFLRATNRYNLNVYKKHTAKCEQLEAENKELREILKRMDEKYQQFLLQPDCSTCAGNFTKVCTCLPGPDEPVRINCPHYTKAEVRT